MIFIPLADKRAYTGFKPEVGFSLYIESDKKVLLDVGLGTFHENAKHAEINLAELDAIVLSHGHADHTNALSLIRGAKLYMHPECFVPSFPKEGDGLMKPDYQMDWLASNYELHASKGPVKISDNIYFLGEIPRVNDFESKKTPLKKADGTDDFVMDDTGLAVKTPRGLVVVTGCCHSGICNTVKHAVDVTGEEKVHSVVGGFHLFHDNQLVDKTIAGLKALKVDSVYPGHCVGDAVQKKLLTEFDGLPLMVGMGVTFQKPKSSKSDAELRDDARQRMIDLILKPPATPADQQKTTPIVDQQKNPPQGNR